MEKGGVAEEVAAALKPLCFENGGMRGGIFTVKQASTGNAAEMPAIIQQQAALYKKIVIKNENPSLIAGKNS